MPEDEADVFAMFIHWLTNGWIFDLKVQNYPEVRKDVDIYVRKLYKLLYLADKLGVRNELANKVMDKIQDIQLRYRKRPSAIDINAICANTLDKSKLRSRSNLFLSWE